jgi:hypothetical protein
MIRGLPLPVGAVVHTAIANPAAGAQFAYVSPDGFECLLLGVRFRFVAGVFVITRYPGLILGFDGLPFFLRTSIGVTAGAVTTFYWTTGGAFIETATANGRQLTMPYPLIFKGGIGNDIVSDVVNMQAADQLSNIILYWLQMPLTG